MPPKSLQNAAATPPRSRASSREDPLTEDQAPMLRVDAAPEQPSAHKSAIKSESSGVSSDSDVTGKNAFAARLAGHGSPRLRTQPRDVAPQLPPLAAPARLATKVDEKYAPSAPASHNVQFDDRRNSGDKVRDGSFNSDFDHRSVSPTSLGDGSPNHLNIPGAINEVSQADDDNRPSFKSRNASSNGSGRDLKAGLLASAKGSGSGGADLNKVHGASDVNDVVALGQKAGMQLAKVASGQRLKPSGSYRRQLDASALNFNDAKTPSPQKGDGMLSGPELDAQGAGEGARLDLNDDANSLASTALTDALGRRRRNRTLLERIPMWIQVCFMMLIPLIFVTTYLSLTLHEALVNMNFITDNSEIVDQIFACERVMQLERGRSSEYIIATAQADKQLLREQMNQRRVEVDNACNDLSTRAQSSKYAVVSENYFNIVRSALAELAVLRYMIDTNATTASNVRVNIREQVSAVTNGISLIAKQSVVARKLLNLKDLRAASNRMGMCRAVGHEIVIDGRIRSHAMRIEYDRNCAEAFRRYFRDFRDLGNGPARDAYLHFMGDPRAQQALTTINFISSLAVGQRITLDADTYFQDFTDVINLMDEEATMILEGIKDAPAERKALRDEIIKLVITLVVSLVGIGFVSRAQKLATARVDFALERTKKTAMAVQAFIPRNFVKLMAVESILNIERGDQTLVAVTMLFCDIRNFTGISEHMTNEQLFDWLQAHLQRMTRMTEKHHGFVNNFIGDAVSSIFIAPADAVKCAVDMQAVTDALCAELVAHNEDHMVKIGVGVHQAIVGVGILGNDKHHSCTIVSAEVNVAAQLEALTKLYGARILVTSQVFDQLKADSFEHRVLGRVRLSLHSDKEFVLYDVFQADPLPSKAYKRAIMDQWYELLALYEAGDSAGAAAMLARIEAVARERKIKDPALAIKHENHGTGYDVFDMD